MVCSKWLYRTSLGTTTAAGKLHWDAMQSKQAPCLCKKEGGVCELNTRRDKQRDNITSLTHLTPPFTHSPTLHANHSIQINDSSTPQQAPNQLSTSPSAGNPRARQTATHPKLLSSTLMQAHAGWRRECEQGGVEDVFAARLRSQRQTGRLPANNSACMHMLARGFWAR
jgi:hypothetical protein